MQRERFDCTWAALPLLITFAIGSHPSSRTTLPSLSTWTATLRGAKQRGTFEATGVSRLQAAVPEPLPLPPTSAQPPSATPSAFNTAACTSTSARAFNAPAYPFLHIWPHSSHCFCSLRMPMKAQLLPASSWHIPTMHLQANIVPTQRHLSWQCNARHHQPKLQSTQAAPPNLSCLVLQKHSA